MKVTGDPNEASSGPDSTPRRQLFRPQVAPDLGDLPAGWAVLLLASLFGGGAAVVGVPFLLGHRWLWEHVRFVGPAFSFVYLGLTERWWLGRARLDDRTDCRQRATGLVPLAQGPGHNHRALSRLRHRAAWAIACWTMTPLLMLVVVFVVWPAGQSGVQDNYRIIDSQPHLQLRVVAVHEHELDSSGPTIVVFVPGDGDEELLFGDYVHPVPHVGDTVEAVVDPAYPGDVIPVVYKTGGENENSWADLAAFGGILVAVGYVGWFRPGAAPLGAALAVRRATNTCAVRVVGNDEKGIVVARTDGVLLRWRLDTRPGRCPPIGTVLTVAGDVSEGGHAAAVYRHWVLWTDERLRPDAGGADRGSRAAAPG